MRFLRSTAAVAAVAAAMLSQNASAVNITTDGIGEVAIAPYYSVRQGKNTLINLVNTTNLPVAVKVRFHEAFNSRDVLDFVVTLSANDVFVGTLKLDKNDSNKTIFVSNDSVNSSGLPTCTVPRLAATGLTPVGPGVFASAPVSSAGYFGGTPSNTDDGAAAANIDRTREGYVEFIVLGTFDQTLRRIENAVGTLDNTVAFDAEANYDLPAFNKLDMIGQAIERHDCATVVAAFTEPNVLRTAQQAGEPVNSLKFNFSIIDAGGGIEAGATATTWANFYNPGDANAVVEGAVGVGAVAVDADGIPLAQVANGQLNPGESVKCAVHRGRQRSTGVNPQPAQADWYANGAAESCRNFVAAQASPQFLEPTLNDAFPVVATYTDDAAGQYVAATPVTPTVGEAHSSRLRRGVDAVSLTIQRQRIINEWATNPVAGVSTDWVVTQPTKSFYVDQGLGDQYAVIADPVTGVARLGQALFKLRPTAVLDENPNDLVPYNPYDAKFTGTGGAGKSCNNVSYSIFDRAEQSPPGVTGDVDFSPAPPLDLSPQTLCYESTVVTFGEGGDDTNPTQLGVAANRLFLSTAGLPDSLQTDGTTGPNQYGWASLSLYDLDPNSPASKTSFIEARRVVANTTVAANDPVVALVPVAAARPAGLPVIGFSLKSRVMPNNPEKSFANNSEHSYLRGVAP